MNNLFFRGRAKRRTVKLRDGNTAYVQFSTAHRPVGATLDLPDGERTLAQIDHTDAPIGVKVVEWSRDNDCAGVSLSEIDEFLAGKPVPGARLMGDAQIVAEQAVRKKADAEGSEVEEWRFTLRVAFDDLAPFHTTTLGAMLRDKAFALSISPAQVELPAMPARVQRRNGPKDAQTALPLGDAAPQA